MQHLAKSISGLDICISEQAAVPATRLSAQALLSMLSSIIKAWACLSNSAGLSCMCRMVSRL